MREEDIFKYLRAQTIKWWGHLNRMGRRRRRRRRKKKARKITEWNPIGMIFKGGRKSRWKDGVLKDIKELKLKNWTYLVKDRKAWYKLVQKTETHKGL
jgi:hypothetical protein